MRCGFSGNVLLVAASTLLSPALGTGSPILAGMGPVHHMLTHVGPPAAAAAAPADNGGTVMMDLLHAYRARRDRRGSTLRSSSGTTGSQCACTNGSTLGSFATG